MIVSVKIHICRYCRCFVVIIFNSRKLLLSFNSPNTAKFLFVVNTSQLPVASWYEVIGEATIADAILDRLVHTSHRIELKGESLRKKTVILSHSIF